jgi:hypothetical protein
MEPTQFESRLCARHTADSAVLIAIEIKINDLHFQPELPVRRKLEHGFHGWAQHFETHFTGTFHAAPNVRATPNGVLVVLPERVEIASLGVPSEIRPRFDHWCPLEDAVENPHLVRLRHSASVKAIVDSAG